MSESSALLAAFSDHSRTFDGFRHVYPVLSRRSGGLSIGVNLNLDKLCNFDCPYCQVDRRRPSPRSPVAPELVDSELREILGRYARTGLSEVFPGIPAEARLLKDVALSGDGEPTLEPSFPAICHGLLALQERWRSAGGTPFHLVCITNATRLDQPEVLLGLKDLCSIDGEIWAKLDAGTDDWYRRMNASRVPFERVTENIVLAARELPVRIQTLWMEFEGASPSDAEITAWAERVSHIHRRSPLRGVQIHTVARATSRPGCHPLPMARLEAIGAILQPMGIPVEIHGGIESGSIEEHPILPS